MSQAKRRPRLVITMGDPRGVGPEIIVKAWPRLRRHADLVVCGRHEILEEASRLMGRKTLPGLRMIEPDPKVTRRSSRKRCGEASLACIEAAVGAVMSGLCDAMVTAPICKEHIHLAGAEQPGHTELLAQLSGSSEQTYLMMVGSRLRVTLTTLHEPLLKVPQLLTKKRVLGSIERTHEILKSGFDIERPRLALAGFNPHAGEGGLFGSEEKKRLEPSVRAAHKEGIDIEGPLPGDTVFYRAVQGDFDAVISPYHDQGLIPVKLLHFEDAVNMTLGLPFVRTSVDHGCAFDIAWSGRANPKSLIAAADLAVKLVSSNRSADA